VIDINPDDLRTVRVSGAYLFNTSASSVYYISNNRRIVMLLTAKSTGGVERSFYFSGYGYIGVSTTATLESLFVGDSDSFKFDLY